MIKNHEHYVKVFECFCHIKNINIDVFLKECSPGYVGIDCSRTCRYPNYGKGCQDVCNCDQQDCHAIKGCDQGEVSCFLISTYTVIFF